VTAEPERKSGETGFDSRSEAEIRQSLWRMGGATNKNKGLRQIVNPFSLSKTYYKVTTKG
jgi:hypothetical protein